MCRLLQILPRMLSVKTLFVKDFPFAQLELHLLPHKPNPVIVWQTSGIIW